MTRPNFGRTIARLLPRLVDLRRDLHQHPELAFHEHRTSQRVLEQLADIDGLIVRSGVAGTGIIATLTGSDNSRCVALRADMDALPIHEAGDLPYRSENHGVMHACGHDGHTTLLVGTALVLAAHRDTLPGTVRFIFQPAEEHGGGGKKMVEAGALADPTVDAAFAMHGWPEAPLGSLLVGAGPILSAASAWRLELCGTGTHAAYPHMGSDVVLTASEIVIRLQRIVARTTDPVDPAVVSVTSIHAGDTYNVIPERLTMLGTIRGLRQETHDAVAERVRAIVESTASSEGVEATLTFVESYPSLVNDASAARVAEQAGAEIFGTEQVVCDPPISLGAEDFSYYAREVPSAMWRLGLRPPDRDRYPMLHQPDFDFRDEAIPLGIEMHCLVARKFLTDGFQDA